VDRTCLFVICAAPLARRAPDIARALVDAGAELLVAPAAWVAGPLKEEHLGVLAHARALDNTMYVAVGAQTGPAYTGRSVIVDPLGATLAGLADAEGVAVGEVSRERLTAARARLPVLAQRRAAAKVTASRR